MTRTCKYEPCGKEFEPTHWRQEFCNSTCRADNHYAEHPAKRQPGPSGALPCVAAHPLDEVRGRQEEGKTSAEWLAIARVHLERTLLTTGYFTADDLAELNIPEKYRRSIHGSVTGFYSAPGYMVEAGRRKSERPERKGGKNTVFRITEKGRRELSKLAGVDADKRSESAAGLDSAESPVAPAPISVDPGESRVSGHAESPLPHSRDIGTADPAAPEPLTLLPEPPKAGMVDPDQRRAA